MKNFIHLVWIPVVVAVPMIALVVLLFVFIPGPTDRETEWNVLRSPRTGLCYEVVSISRAADLVYPIADEYCAATNLTKK